MIILNSLSLETNIECIYSVNRKIMFFYDYDELIELKEILKNY